jgi:hypothetical protein
MKSILKRNTRTLNDESARGQVLMPGLQAAPLALRKPDQALRNGANRAHESFVELGQNFAVLREVIDRRCRTELGLELSELLAFAMRRRPDSRMLLNVQMRWVRNVRDVTGLMIVPFTRSDLLN